MTNLFASLFRRKKSPASRTARLPDGVVVWAIGDVHGRSDLLLALLKEAVRDLRAQKPQRAVIVMLGDYVDRGPDSKGVIDLLCKLSDQDDIETRFVRGNHEERFEGFLSDPDLGPSWCEYGGREALLSYGVLIPALKTNAEDLMWIRREFLIDKAAFEKVVVHGHTPDEHVHSDHRRIGVDTGAYATGVLTGLRLEGDQRRICQTRIVGKVVELSATDL